MLAAAMLHNMEAGTALLAELRTDLGRQPRDPLSWKNIRTHPQRLHVARKMGGCSDLTISVVVVCKRYLEPLQEQNLSYMFAFRLLLERLSWIAVANHTQIETTLAQISGFKMEQLREYERRLKGDITEIKWAAIKGATKIDQPNRIEHLQLGDLAASAIAQAFNVDEFGNAERRYLMEIAPRLYRRGSGALTSYGLKFLPWNDATKRAYAWVTRL